MAQFYKELKELRESREISLDEISERTKINVSYLKAIESGEFSEIETPYLRLFLRAYAEEIGGDSLRALEQLDSFLGTKRPKLISHMVSDDEMADENEAEKHIRISSPSKELRQDYLIGGILSLILLFAIAIFQKIFNEDSNAIVTKEGPQLQTVIEPLSNDDLSKDFILDQASEELLPIAPPFFVKIKTLEQTAYTFLNDTLPSIRKIINANQEIDLKSFINSSKLILSTTRGVSIFINANEIKKISEYDFPIRLAINPNPPSIGIERFKPLP